MPDESSALVLHPARAELSVAFRGSRMVRGLEHLSCEERLRKGWDCSTWRRPHCGLKYLKGAYKKDEGTLFGRAMVLN